MTSPRSRRSVFSLPSAPAHCRGAAFVALALVRLAAAQAGPTASELLAELGGTVTAAACVYREGRVEARTVFGFGGTAERFRSVADGWECTRRGVVAEERVDLEVRFARGGDAVADSGVEVRLEFADWSNHNFVLVPGAAYDGNRFRCQPMGYPPFWHDREAWSKHPPVTITDVPRLNDGTGRSRLDLTTGDMTTPAVAVYFPARGEGLLILTEQGTRFGNSGVVIEKN